MVRRPSWCAGYPFVFFQLPPRLQQPTLGTPSLLKSVKMLQGLVIQGALAGVIPQRPRISILVGFRVGKYVQHIFICSIVPVNSCICPSIEFTLVLRVETEPVDRSSEGETKVSEREIVLGTGGGDL